MPLRRAWGNPEDIQILKRHGTSARLGRHSCTGAQRPCISSFSRELGIHKFDMYCECKFTARIIRLTQLPINVSPGPVQRRECRRSPQPNLASFSTSPDFPHRGHTTLHIASSSRRSAAWLTFDEQNVAAFIRCIYSRRALFILNSVRVIQTALNKIPASRAPQIVSKLRP